MTLTFNGKNIADFSAFWDGAHLFDTPEKDVQFISVLGRNGDLSISNGRYLNLEITIPVFIRDEFKRNYRGLMTYLLAQEGYGRLETSEEPDLYRMAQFVTATQPTTGSFNKSGRVDLVFNCKPQKWLKSGEKEISIVSGGSTTIFNPTLMEAKPLIKVTGTGTIVVGTSQLVLARNTSTVYIDSDIEDAYEGTINRNGDLTVTGGFPVLSDETTVSATGCSIQLIPRWWTL